MNSFKNDVAVEGNVDCNNTVYSSQLEVTETSTKTSDDNRHIGRFLKPNIPVGGRVEVLVGETDSRNKSCKFGWYRGATDADSYGIINLYGKEDIITFNSSDVKINGASMNQLISDYNNLKALL